MILNSPYISGSLTVTGNIISSGSITISGSIASASYASNAERVDGLDSTSFVFTSSYNTDSASVSTRVTKIEGNYATTGSNVFMGAQTVCANITSTGTIIAQTLNVQQVTSSIVYSSGSNTFGCLTTDRQQFTGSVTMTGSLAVFTAGTSPEFQVVTGGTIKGNALTDVHQVTGSLRVTGSGPHFIEAGCLGIGTTTPQRLVHISSNTENGIYLSCNSSQLVIANNHTLASKTCSTTIALAGANTDYFPTSCAGDTIIATQAGSILFGTGMNAGVASGTERMRITSAGNVGIGTTTPSASLDVSKAGGLAFRSYYGSGNNRSLDVNIDASNGDAQLTWNTYYSGGWKYFQSNGAARIYSGNGIGFSVAPTGTANGAITWTDALFVSSSGNVGIETTTPVSKLHLRGSGTSGQVTATQIWENTSSGTLGLEISGSAGSSYAAFKYGGGPGTGTATLTQAMAIVLEGAGAGRVGIGTTSPSDKLTVTDASTYTFNVGAASGGAGAVLYTLGSAALTFATNGSSNERMRITSTGNVGIGTCNPQKPLELRTGGTSTTPSQLFAGGISQVIVGGETQIAFSSNISPTLGSPTATELARAGIGFQYLSSAQPSEFSIGIQCVNTCGANVKIWNVCERIRITCTGDIRVNFNPGGSNGIYFQDVTNGAAMFYVIPATYVGSAPYNSNRFLAANSSNIAFETGGGERMRITSGGSINLTTGISGPRLFSYCADMCNLNGLGLDMAGCSYEFGLFFAYGTSDNGRISFGSYQQTCYRSKMIILGNGNIGVPGNATAIYNASDCRLKNNIQPLNYGLAQVMCINPVKFNWKCEFLGEECSRNNFGFIAQEVQSVLPDLVEQFGGSEVILSDGTVVDHPLRINEKNMTALLVKAIQELKCENNIFKTCLGLT